MILLPQQAPPEKMPSHFDLGKTDAEIIIKSANANKNAAISLVKQGHLAVSIFTQELDPQVLNNKDFAQHLLRMAKNYNQMKIQILVKDSMKAVKSGHVLIRLAQQLSSHIEVKMIPEIFYDVRASFMVVDRAGFYFRQDEKEFVGSVNFNSKARAAKLLEFFSDVWEKAEPDPHFRKLHL